MTTENAIIFRGRSRSRWWPRFILCRRPVARKYHDEFQHKHTSLRLKSTSKMSTGHSYTMYLPYRLGLTRISQRKRQNCRAFGTFIIRSDRSQPRVGKTRFRGIERSYMERLHIWSNFYNGFRGILCVISQSCHQNSRAIWLIKMLIRERLQNRLIVEICTRI